METNDMEKQMRQVQKNLNNCLKYIEEIEKEVAILRKDSHPPVLQLERRLRKLEKKQGD